MASYDNVLKATNSKGRVVYYLGYNSYYSRNMARFLSNFLRLGDFDDETPDELLQKAEADEMEFVACSNPEEIQPGEETMWVDFGKKISSLPALEVASIDDFCENYDVQIVEKEGNKYIVYDDDPEPLQAWPDRFKFLLDLKESDIDLVVALCAFIEEEGCGVDFIADDRIVHCEEL